MKHIALTIITMLAALTANAQAQFFKSAKVDPQPVKTINELEQQATEAEATDSVALVTEFGDIYEDPFLEPMTIPDVFFMPPVYTTYRWAQPLQVGDTVYSGNPAMRWIEDYELQKRQMMDMQYDLFYNHPDLVRYNLSMLPEAPKQYHATVNPADHTITIVETVSGPAGSLTIAPEQITRRHWIRTFTASLQFSQAYVSPNWYQGGNNNLNALINVYYNVKLNPAFHPNLLFETTFQYKLGFNSAPDDSLHNYNISDDLLQINTLLGIKAIEKWYYSVTGQFKTQLFNAYRTNSHALRSAFMSPAELNLALGMTYSTTNRKKTFAFDANISPLSYNMTICTNRRMDETAYGIDPGHKTLHKFGSKLEFTLNWKICYNISLRSRLFGFTDYDRTYCDWENTLMFEVNKYITTQVFTHLRYDTDTPKVENENWHKLQFKEILSLGFAYRFSSL